eukprot:m.602481 g.602481  ORF g.602481 m.602481 type:complete len:597 (-) comp22444_c0_seq1:8-1798(-)
MAEVLAMNPEYGVSSLQAISWVVVIGIQAAVMLGFTMGANDVANAFGTSVGAGILTINQACIIASIFDVTGSLTLGAGVSSTIASKIIDVSIYESQPGLYMVGMLSASLGAMACVGVATKLGMPISTTHAVVGAVMGFSFVETTQGLVWFNGKAGLGSIFLSWVVSPIFAGLVSAGVYVLSRYFCFQYADKNTSDVMLRFAFERQHKLSAFIMGWVAFLIVIFVSYSMTTSGTVFDYLNVLFALIALAAVTVLSYKTIIPRVVHFNSGKRTGKYVLLPKDQVAFERAAASKSYTTFADPGHTGRYTPLLPRPSTGTTPDDPSPTPPHITTTETGDVGRADQVADEKGQSIHIFVKDTEDTTAEDKAAEHAPTDSGDVVLNPGDDTAVSDKEEADITADCLHPELERRFNVLSVTTASFMAYTHGANDISNAAGPLVAIWNTYTSGTVGQKVDVVYWVVVLCCVGVVLGLLIWGKHVISTVGFKITKITPSRAFTIELGTATSVLCASFLKLPVSSTHCFIGSVVAVGMCSGEGRKAIKWPMIRKILVSWVVTVPVAGLVSCVIFLGLKHVTEGVLPPQGYAVAFYEINSTNITANW